MNRSWGRPAHPDRADVVHDGTGVARGSGWSVLLAAIFGSKRWSGHRAVRRVGLVLRDPPQDMDHAAGPAESRAIHGGEYRASGACAGGRSGACLSLIVLAAWMQGTGHWESLLSSIVGMCFGGGLIWGVRIVGKQALRVEAMGFGDVTLMAMIGEFLGWQAAFLIFFLAPFTALLIAAAQRILAGQRHIAFGPYLCLATLIVVLGWNAVWTDWARAMFSLGWFIPILLVCCLVLMGGLLWLCALVRDAWL